MVVIAKRLRTNYSLDDLNRSITAPECRRVLNSYTVHVPIESQFKSRYATVRVDTPVHNRVLSLLPIVAKPALETSGIIP